MDQDLGAAASATLESLDGYVKCICQNCKHIKVNHSLNIIQIGNYHSFNFVNANIGPEYYHHIFIVITEESCHQSSIGPQ